MNSLLDIETLRRAAKEILPLYQSDWLLKATEILRLDFEQIGEIFSKEICIEVNYPGYNIPIAWLGTYWETQHLILINPTVDGLTALDILVHELVHASISTGDHGKRFMEVASAIGLDDDGPSAGAKKVLLKRLKNIQEMLGSYPLVFDCVEN